MVKECTLSTGKLPLGGLHSNRVVRITHDCPDMISAVFRGHKVLKKKNRFNFGIEKNETEFRFTVKSLINAYALINAHPPIWAKY